MKKVISFLMAIAIIISGFSVVIAAETVDVYVNGQYLESDQPAIIVNNRTLVPIRAICEALNCTVEWDELSQTIQVRNSVVNIALQIDNYIMTRVSVNDEDDFEYIKLDVPPIIYNNRTLVPLRAISEAFYADVYWDEENHTVSIVMEYDSISGFDEEGYAIAEKDGRYGVINKNREVVVPLIYDYVYGYAEGLSAAELNGKYGFLDRFGNVVIPFEYDLALGFLEGLAAVSKNDKYGVIDKSGKVIVPFIYDYVAGFNDGLTQVQLGQKIGFIDKTGTIVIPIEYDGGSMFFNGLASVKKDDKWGYIDKNNNTAIPFIYEDAGNFEFYGLAAVKKNGKYGFINTKGESVTPFEYDGLQIILPGFYWEYPPYFSSDGYARVRKGTKYGLIDVSGSVVIPIEYDEISNWKDDAICVTKDNEMYYINFNNERIY